MKTQQHHEAEQLFFQHNLSKTEIAEKLNVNRRTITLWAQQGNWDKIRKSSQHMPSILAEKCYHLLDQYLTHLLTDGAIINTFTLKHAQTIHLLTNSIKKLKNRSTTNESMEMFNFFLPGLQRRDPKLAADLVPYVEEYINIRSSVDTADFLPDGFNADGSIPYPEKEIQETYQDERDTEALNLAFEEFVRTQPTAPPPAAQEPPTTEQKSPYPAPASHQQPTTQKSPYPAPVAHHQPATQKPPYTDTALSPYNAPRTSPAPALGSIPYAL